MKKSFFSLCFLAVSAFSICAQTSVSFYNSQKDILDGVAYSLPKTKINIAITATCTIKKAGPFYQYAKRYLATNNAIIDNSRVWSVTDVQFQPVAVPDPTRTFQVAFDKKGISNNISFYDNYIISAVNATPAEVAPVKEFKVVNDEPVDVVFTSIHLNEETLMSTSIPKMAEMAARQIYRIRESRFALLSAEVENMPDGKALKAILNKMNNEERDLLSLFLGKTVSYSVTKVYSVTPDSDMKNLVLARISAAEGIVDALNVIGNPIYLNISGKHLSSPASNRKREKGVKGFYFNVPGEAVVSVSADDFSAESFFSMPQFGYVNFLNAELTKDTTAKIVYNPLLGTITSFSK